MKPENFKWLRLNGLGHLRLKWTEELRKAIQDEDKEKFYIAYSRFAKEKELSEVKKILGIGNIEIPNKEVELYSFNLIEGSLPTLQSPFYLTVEEMEKFAKSLEETSKSFNQFSRTLFLSGLQSGKNMTNPVEEEKKKKYWEWRLDPTTQHFEQFGIGKKYFHNINLRVLEKRDNSNFAIVDLFLSLGWELFHDNSIDEYGNIISEHEQFYLWHKKDPNSNFIGLDKRANSLSELDENLTDNNVSNFLNNVWEFLRPYGFHKFGISKRSEEKNKFLRQPTIYSWNYRGSLSIIDASGNNHDLIFENLGKSNIRGLTYMLCYSLDNFVFTPNPKNENPTQYIKSYVEGKTK